MGKDLSGKELGQNLCQCKDGRYLGRYTDRFGKRHNIYGHKLKDVRDKLNKAIFESKLGVENYDTNLTLDDVYNEWLAHKYDTIKMTTCIGYKSRYENHIKPKLGFIKIHKIKTKDLEGVFVDVPDGTVKVIKIIIRNLFKFAIKRKYIITDPSINMITPKITNNAERVVLTKEQQKVFIRFLNENDYRYSSLFQVLLLTGLRVGEALALTWKDIDFEKRFITVNKTLIRIKDKNSNRYIIQSPKTEKSNRKVPMSAKTIEILYAHKDSSYTSAENVFVSKLGNDAAVSNVERSLREIITKFNKEECDLAVKEDREPRLLPQITPHCLRHTFATNCFENGIDGKIVQRYLGHASLSMTMDLYTHVNDQILFEYIDKNDDVYD